MLTIEEPTTWAIPAAPPTAVKGGRGAAQGTRGIVVAARSSIHVAGVARLPNGQIVGEVLLNKNNALVKPLPDGSVHFEGYITVEDKATSAQITVISATGSRATQTFPLTAGPPKPPAATAEEGWSEASSGYKGQRWAVVIGISQYQDTTLSLQYADRDAKDFYNFLMSPRAGDGGFNPSNVKLLLNSGATREKIATALFDFLKAATEEDVVYIFYAGHGAADPDRASDLYLLPYNANVKSLGGTGFSFADMYRALNTVRAKYKVLITDACHSGAIGSTATRGALTDINNKFIDAMSTNAGFQTVITSAEGAELAKEGPEYGGGHGAFTYYLLKGLKGEADTNRDHVVSIGEMFDYTYDRVARTAGHHPHKNNVADDRSFPVSMVMPGDSIPDVPLEQIQKYQEVSDVRILAGQVGWQKPEGFTTMVGTPDTLRIYLDNSTHDRIPAAFLRWSSDNTSVATVDSAGVVSGVNSGFANIKVEGTAGMERSITVPIKVMPKVLDVRFTPAADTVELVQSESVQVQTDLLTGPDLWVTNAPTKYINGDSSIVRAEADGKYVAVREGFTTITTGIAGHSKTWIVHVVAPMLKVPPLRASLPMMDSLPLTARILNRKGVDLGDARGVNWESSDTTKAVVHNNVLYTRGIGRVSIKARMGPREDSVSTMVLGDLLVSIKRKGVETVAAVKIGTGEMAQLIPDSLKATEASLSPAGDRIAFVSKGRLFIAKSDGSDIKRLTPNMNGLIGVRTSSYEERSPSWTADGQRIVFISNAYGGTNYEVLGVKPDGTDVQRLTNDSHPDKHVSAAPDVGRIAFDREVSSSDADIVIALMDGSQVQAFHDQGMADLGFAELKPHFLRGGKQLVAVQRAPGRDGEALILFDVSLGRADGKKLVKALKDHSILFAVSPDGKRIAYNYHPDWSGKSSSISVIDLEGNTLSTFSLGADVEITDIAWGAYPIR
jgi:hypothetical protein